MKKLPLGTMVISVEPNGIFFGLIIKSQYSSTMKHDYYYIRWNDGYCDWYTETHAKAFEKH